MPEPNSPEPAAAPAHHAPVCPHCRAMTLRLNMNNMQFGNGVVVAVCSCADCGSLLPAQIIGNAAPQPTILRPNALGPARRG